MVFSAVSAGALGKKFTNKYSHVWHFKFTFTDLKYIKKIENTECKLFYKHFIWVYF